MSLANGQSTDWRSKHARRISACVSQTAPRSDQPARIARKVAALVALAGGALLCACTPSPGAQTPGGEALTADRASYATGSPVDIIEYQGLRYVRLPGSDIPSLLLGHDLVNVAGSHLSPRYLTETFLANNAYLLARQEPPIIHGEWYVRNDSICVLQLGNSSASCRKVFLNRRRMLVLLLDAAGHRSHHALQSVDR